MQLMRHARAHSFRQALVSLLGSAPGSCGDWCPSCACLAQATVAAKNRPLSAAILRLVYYSVSAAAHGAMGSTIFKRAMARQGS